VNKGGDPERDDYGLPQVDVVVPDDARELDADIEAYHRELRALRRQARSRRWRLRGSHQVLQRTGLVMPLVAGCLVLAMLSGMVLTMFTANSYLEGASRLGASRAGPSRPGPSRPSTPRPGATGGPGAALAGPKLGHHVPPLPSKRIDVAGHGLVVLSSLRGVALAIIPRRCACSVVVQLLLLQAGMVGVAVYLVGTPSSQAEIRVLAAGSPAGQVHTATDTKDVLLSSFGTRLTVLLVDRRGYATAVSGLRPGFQLQRQLASLRSGG
jgi:hypothetical protein